MLLLFSVLLTFDNKSAYANDNEDISGQISQSVADIVSNLEEALELRKNGIKDEILMLTPTSIKEEIKSLIENDVTLTIGTMDELKLAQEVLSELKKDSHTAHIKIDTGFGRYGFVYTEKEKILDAIKNSGNINNLDKVSGKIVKIVKIEE